MTPFERRRKRQTVSACAVFSTDEINLPIFRLASIDEICDAIRLLAPIVDERDHGLDALQIDDACDDHHRSVARAVAVHTLGRLLNELEYRCSAYKSPSPEEQEEEYERTAVDSHEDLYEPLAAR